MSLYLLNISVDHTDPNPNHLPEDLEINDQESIVEIVVEEILGYEDAINECDDPDTGDSGKKSNVLRDLTAQSTDNSSINHFPGGAVKQKFPHYNPLLDIGFQNLDTPPPKT